MTKLHDVNDEGESGWYRIDHAVKQAFFAGGTVEGVIEAIHFYTARVAAENDGVCMCLSSVGYVCSLHEQDKVE